MQHYFLCPSACDSGLSGLCCILSISSLAIWCLFCMLNCIITVFDTNKFHAFFVLVVRYSVLALSEIWHQRILVFTSLILSRISVFALVFKNLHSVAASLDTQFWSILLSACYHPEYSEVFLLVGFFSGPIFSAVSFLATLRYCVCVCVNISKTA